MRKIMRSIRRAGSAVNSAIPAKVKGAAVVAGVVMATAASHAQETGGGTFDVSTLYSGAAAAFSAAATIAGGFLAIKFGAKMVKKAWASYWLADCSCCNRLVGLKDGGNFFCRWQTGRRQELLWC